MTIDKLVLDVGALETINATIGEFLKQIGNSIDELIANVLSINSQWNDDQYELIVKFIKEFYVEYEKISSKGMNVSQKALEKINMIKSLHGISI